MRRELARLQRENQLLRSQLRTKTPIPRSTRRAVADTRRGLTTPSTLGAHDVIAGRYELERLLARGGMGAVWVAHDYQTGDSVAVKFLGSEAGPHHVARFEREAEVCDKLRSKHVVRVLSHGVDGDRRYLAMELLRGESLSSLLRRHAKLSLSESCQLVQDIADALAPAHAAGIVHRDLKPQNFFLSLDEEGVRTLKLLDFGVAKELAEAGDMTESGVIIGSPSYMSPEQAYGVRHVDQRSDLWSVAVILYRVLTGHRPWDGEVALELLYRICTEPAPPPSTYEPRLGPKIDAFFDKAFAKDPQARFATVEELAHEFIRAASTPSSPPPLSPSMRSPMPSNRGSLVPLTEARASQVLEDLPDGSTATPSHRRLSWVLGAFFAVFVVVVGYLLVT